MIAAFKINDTLIEAVPSVHYRSVFAVEVNKICSCEATRPEAIAVELGPDLAAEVRNWMQELGISPFTKTILPCMLGLLYGNRLIHPGYYDTAIQLQGHLQEPLGEISCESKNHLLNYSDRYLAALSSTDSIIEAVRCSIELSIPLYGIDLDEFSARQGSPLLVEDPSDPDLDISSYVMKYGSYSASCRDTFVDGRREYAMSARLKALLPRNKRILLVCGLAHWENIIELMNDPAVKPADEMAPAVSHSFKRIIIHPKIAVSFMDVYPVLATIYEKLRINSSEKDTELFRMPDYAKVYRDILDKVYCSHDDSIKPGRKPGNSGGRFERVPEFERLVMNHQLISQHYVPGLKELLECARTIMPAEFYDLLAGHLMDIEQPWASPWQFPELPMLSRIPEESKETGKKPTIELYNLTESGKDTKDNPSWKKRSASFTVKYRDGFPLPGYLLSTWKWDDEPEHPGSQGGYFDWVWPPCEALLFGIAYEASKIAVTRTREAVPEVFEGSLFDGLDIRATIRSATSGERKIYVRRTSSSKKHFTPDGKKPEPTVFIFDSETSDNKANWSLLIAGTNLRSYLKDTTEFDRVVQKYGGYFVSSISRVRYHPVPPHLSGYVVSSSILDGITAFGSPCINAIQSAQWVEDNNFKACPVLTSTSIDTMINYYRDHYSMIVSKADWKTALIRFAIPYAKERVVVVAPRNFKVLNELHSEAKKRNISIDQIPLTWFPAEQLAEMRQRLIVRAIDNDGITFTPETELALGQKADKYYGMLPLYMQQQLRNQ
jgi:hypothetical protein